jgi:hypothetical protein
VDGHQKYPQKIGIPFQWTFTRIPNQPESINKITGVSERNKRIIYNEPALPGKEDRNNNQKRCRNEDLFSRKEELAIDHKDNTPIYNRETNAANEKNAFLSISLWNSQTFR